MIRLVESDIPKFLPGEARRFLASPGWPPLGIENFRMVGNIAQFEVVNRTPLPILAFVGARFPMGDQEIWSEKAKEIIGPLGRDEWQTIPPEGAQVMDLRVGIFPFEIALAREEFQLR